MYTYEELKGFVDHCGRCELCRTRNHSVMGKGNLHSPILFIAEAPGRNEDRDGVPFTGRSGELFDRLLREIEMKREEIYLTNIVKCNPPGNRDPYPKEQEACIPYLKLLAGEEKTYTGIVEKGRNLIISYVPQDTSWLQGNLSDFARENRIEESLFKALLRKLDFDRVQFEKDMSEFSSGQKKKVLLAKSLCEKAHLYVWDEPLNFVDLYSRMQIEALIREYKPTMVLVEHDKAFREEIGTKHILIEKERE